MKYSLLPLVCVVTSVTSMEKQPLLESAPKPSVQIDISSRQSQPLRALQDAIKRHDYQQVHGLLKDQVSQRDSRNTSSPFSPQDLESLMSLAQETEDQALNATGTQARTLHIISGLLALCYGGGTIALNTLGSLECSNTPAPQRFGSLMGNVSNLTFIGGGLYCLYKGITNAAQEDKKADAQVVTHLVKTHAAPLLNSNQNDNG